MNNLITRSISGAIFVAIIIAAILVNQWIFVVAFSVILVIALHEYYNLVSKGKSKAQIYLGSFIGLLAFIYSFSFYVWPEFREFGLLLLPILILVFIGELYRKHETPLHNVAITLLGLAYVALPFWIMNSIVFYEGAFDGKILLGVFLLVWINDSWAYVFGVSFGKHRLFERVSPKKSWEGLIGGAVFTVLASLIASRFLGLETFNWVIIASIIIVFGTFGDLVESLFKRGLLIKDSGNVIPGHGGILDRFDSMLFSIPVVFVYLYLIR